MEYECPVMEKGKMRGKKVNCLVNNTAVCRTHAKAFNIAIQSR